MEIPIKRMERFKPKPKKLNLEAILNAIHADRSVCVTLHNNSFKSNDITTTTRSLDVKEALEVAKSKLHHTILQRMRTTEVCFVKKPTQPTEAEYRAAEILWVTNLLHEPGQSTSQQPVIYCDNSGASYVCVNHVFHSKMKHLALGYHFVRENVQNGHLRVSYISTQDQLADALIKPLPRTQFQALIPCQGTNSTKSLS
ncbi:unnamed protein product [Amaranthus hypochondriacus]